MPALTLVTTNRLRIVESFVQMTLPAAEAIAAGQEVAIDSTTGRFVLAAGGNAYGTAPRTVAAGEALTAIRVGVLAGYDLAALSYGAKVFQVEADLADTAGTVTDPVGMVVPGTAKVIGVDLQRGAGDRERQPVTLIFEVPYPYLLASADEPAMLDDGLALDSAWNLDGNNQSTLVIDAMSESLAIANSGPVPIARQLITVTPRAGATLSGLLIHNTTNHHRLAWRGTLAAGETLYIDTLSQHVHVDGTAAYADLTVEARQRLWMRLEPGSNAIVMTATSLAGTVDLVWNWSRHYLL